MKKAIQRLAPQTTLFLECDIQQKLAPHLIKNATMVHNAKRLAQMSHVLDIPVIATRHVAKNFGDIDAEIGAVSKENRKVFDKSLFSMLEEPVLLHIEELGGVKQRQDVVLYGAEAHVCIKQTCFDLLEKGFNVHLVIDAITSMNHHDRNVGIESMKMNGAQVTTFQALAFELLKDFQHPKFKEVFQFVKDMPLAAPSDDQNSKKPDHLDLFYFGNL
mmetsp:Transcript_5602/g.9643  ORF Transcript_5602/g.9643 Transcript_5602/m.9643 type:complete len:217 (-) Transcript_5602:64-714(-)